MLYMICSCGSVLANKQLVYEAEMKKVCNELKLDYNMVSKGITQTQEYKERMKEILNKITNPHRLCCRQALLTYTDVVTLIK